MTLDAGDCLPYQIQGRDFNGIPVSYSGPSLSYGLPDSTMNAPVQAFSGTSCTQTPLFFPTPPNPQSGSLRMPKFGEVVVRPTITSTGPYSPGPMVTVRSRARLTGFPTALRYNVCTPTLLSTSAPAYGNTLLNLVAAGGDWTFDSSTMCNGFIAMPILTQDSSSIMVGLRTTTGGTVTLTGSPNVLDFTPVTVTLLRPDGGSPCAVPGTACGADAECCSDLCDKPGATCR
jgi:hypothetical protein